MRTLKLSVLLLLSAVPAFSAERVIHLANDCVDLTGNYECTENGEPTNGNEFSQKVVDGVTVYTDPTGDYVADGQPHAVNWGFFTGQHVSQCDAQRLNILLTGEVFFDDGDKLGDISDDETYRMLDPQTLETRYVYERHETRGKVIRLSGTEICKKIPN